MSKDKDKPYWYVTVEMDYAAKEYRGINTIPSTPAVTINQQTPYVLVQADDEIGAFNEAQKVLQRLGFRIGA